ncbi:MAG: hypothetical protein NTV89_13100, partial [Proteobacteria bacterium]|nr:hypothetical protein [Pseudomonadota bacterium]
MIKRKLFVGMILALAVTALFWGIDQSRAQSKDAAQEAQKNVPAPVLMAQADEQAPAAVEPQADVQQPDSDAVTQAPTGTGSDRLDNYLRMYSLTPAQREAAAKRAEENRAKAAAEGGETNQVSSFAAPLAAVAPTPGGTPDYFGIYPNWANSPTNIRKFVDSLPGLGYANRNDLNQYIPVAIPNTTTYSGSDYYEIGLRDYTQKLHSDLPATKLRGYYQINTTDPNVGANKYLGPVIVAKKDRPVRIKFSNKLATGTAGNLFIPVDTTVMGAGTGPNGGTENYAQNRANIHLHGGATPWISDGTPHQWITPPSDPTSYKKGLSF